MSSLGTQNLIPTMAIASSTLLPRFTLAKTGLCLQPGRAPLAQLLGSGQALLSRTECEPLTPIWQPPS